MDKNQLAKARFEILVVFEAIIETTGLTTLNENVFYA
jgi:hypothetical protein